MSDSIKERRAARRNKSKNIKSQDDIYIEMGDNFQEEESDDGVAIVETVNINERRTRALMMVDYDYQDMAVQYSKENVSQQLGNYRQAMDFLAHITLPNKDKTVDRLKKIIYDFPNIDISSFANKDNAKLYTWMLQQMSHTFGEKYLGSIYMLGGGMGLLASMLLDSRLRFENIRSFDINGACQFLADELMTDELLADWKFKATTQDLFNIGYDTHTFTSRLQNGSLSTPFEEIPGTIINFNVSHLKNSLDWYNMIPDMRRVIIVGEAGKHVPYPFASSQMFNVRFPMSFEHYTGVLTMKDKQYYMKIGHK